MEIYKFKEDEVALLKEEVKVTGEIWKAEIILTNLNIILVTNIKEMLKVQDPKVEVISFENLKLFEGKPYITIKSNIAEIYLKDSEREITFKNRLALHNFVNTTTKAVTHQKINESKADKMKNVLILVNDNIELVQMSANILGSTLGTIAKSFGNTTGLFKIFKNKK